MTFTLIPPSASAPAAQNWVKVQTDGRPYYYNKLTKQTVWQKPADMFGMQEKLILV
jgi:hypothetical protein